MRKRLLCKNRSSNGCNTNRLSPLGKPRLLALTCCILAGAAAASAASHYQRTNVVSDLDCKASTLDSKLINPWGIARGPNSPWWVSDNGSGTSTLYDGMGQPFPVGNALQVTIPPISWADGALREITRKNRGETGTRPRRGVGCGDYQTNFKAI